jgi:hypothetical protein
MNLLLDTDISQFNGLFLMVSLLIYFAFIAPRLAKVHSNRLINILERQNEYHIKQIRLLKKMLINQGTSPEEVDLIIEKGNQKSETQY